MSEQVFSHKPVLLRECLEALNIRPDGVYLDGTLGRAGHSREIAARLTTGRLICIDRDQAAIDAGLELSSSQEAQLMQETADESVVNALFINGYWVGISMPAANARADRGAPTVSVIYAYAGSIQRLECEAVSVI